MFERRFCREIWCRNHLTGKVTEVKKGTIMCQVEFKNPAASKMSSVLVVDSIKELGIKKTIWRESSLRR
jgi:molybdopterin-binding protein